MCLYCCVDITVHDIHTALCHLKNVNNLPEFIRLKEKKKSNLIPFFGMEKDYPWLVDPFFNCWWWRISFRGISFHTSSIFRVLIISWTLWFENKDASYDLFRICGREGRTNPLCDLCYSPTCDYSFVGVVWCRFFRFSWSCCKINIPSSTIHFYCCSWYGIWFPSGGRWWWWRRYNSVRNHMSRVHILCPGTLQKCLDLVQWLHHRDCSTI